MNYLSLDFGIRRIGVAYSDDGFIYTLPMQKNNASLFPDLRSIITKYSISKIYIGLSEKDPVRGLTLLFVDQLSKMLKLPVETVEEALSTIEARVIYQANFGKKKNAQRHLDSVSAAVILRRVINFS